MAQLERKPVSIFKRYLKGWLVVDIVSCLPITYVTALVNASGGSGAVSSLPRSFFACDPWACSERLLVLQVNTKVFKILRLLRLAKLLRLARLKKIIKRYEEEFVSSLAQSAFLKWQMPNFCLCLMG